MRITYMGHACFKIEESGFSVIVDPYKAGSVPGLKPLKETCNQVLSSHMHDDHAGLREVKLSSTRADAPFTLSFIPTYHDDQQGTLRGANNVLIFGFNGKSVVHMGDIGCDLTEDEMEIIKDCDVLMIPVGGFFTITPERAAQYIREINPKIAIPMHYRSSEFGYDVIGTLEDFLKNFDDGSVSINEGDSVLEFDKKPEGNQILCMKPLNIK